MQRIRCPGNIRGPDIAPLLAEAVQQADMQSGSSCVPGC